ncbi:MAG TPA: PhzF family phenazine biosynthesis protein [Thermoanaerobaculia bacterium]|nr:PhzF family phenazine biosynthesis protein [Thermoanaerobaculia bacterium]
MRLLQVDAFTSEAFRGNPAAVCLLDRERDAKWMQDVAAEMNLSETAFLLPQGDDFSLRWFTPAVEVALCGHATLASAHALWEEQGRTHTRFHTKSGVLTAERRGEDIELDFPATREERSDPPPALLESLGVTNPVYVGRNKFDYLVEVESEEIVRSLKPDHARLRTIPVRGVIVTSRSHEFDFVSRFFAPGSGIDEDPVTGSAHCCLTPYWSARLGKNEMTAFQASARGGVVRVRLEGDRVKLRGRAVTVLRGELAV